LKIRFDLSLYILSGAAFTFMFIGLVTPQVYAQSPSPLEEDQDGDGNPLNEEDKVKITCDVDSASGLGEAVEGAFGHKMETTLSEDDCDFVMHYLSGQCEEQTAKGANVTEVCDTFLSDYLKSRGLFAKDFPTDTERFNAILDEYNQKKASEEQENAREETNTPSWAEDLGK
jgi:hypothetical protein